MDTKGDGPQQGSTDVSEFGGVSSDSKGSEFSRQFATALEQNGLGALARKEKVSARDVLAAIGGVRGLVEAMVPGLVFLVSYGILNGVMAWSKSDALWPSLLGSIGLAALFTVLRLLTKGPSASAFGGLVAVGASALITVITGDARDNYVLGFITNAAYLVALLVSLVIRWPVAGFIIGGLNGEPLTWKRDVRKYRTAQVVTLVFISLFCLRLVVQMPLYYANNLVGLGFARIFMGLPLYALVIVFAWLLVRAMWPAEAAGKTE